MAKQILSRPTTKLYLYQGFDEAVIETSHSSKGLQPEQIAAKQNFEVRMCALFMPTNSCILISRTFIEESPATRIFLEGNRALCEEGFIRLLTNTFDAQREREKKQHNYRNVSGIVKYHRAYYDKARAVSDYSSLQIEPKAFNTGKLAHSLWVDIGRGRSIHFMVEDEFEDWVKQIEENDTGNSTWEATRAALYASGIPHEMFDDLHALSFSSYADSHRNNGVGVVTGSLVSNALFSGKRQIGDFDLGACRQFCLRFELSGLLAMARASEVVEARRMLSAEIPKLGISQLAETELEDLAKRIEKMFKKAAKSRNPSLVPFEQRRFKVALTFPGTHRPYLQGVYEGLLNTFDVDDVFYDFKFQAELSGPNLDTKLRRVYREQSDLLVVFVSKSYSESNWCGLEWRVVREFIMQRTKDDRIMFVALEELLPDELPDGMSVIDGYLSAERHSTEEVCEMIARKHQLIASL